MTDQTIKSKQPNPRIQGAAFAWSEPEPWPAAVTADEILQDLSATFRRYSILPPGGEVAVALWVLYTWVFEAFGISPILAVTSPTKRCGKTTVVTLLQSLCRRALVSSSITPAALFRFIEREQPTLIIDEADRFLSRSDELTGILNAGHTKTTARVIRAVGEDFEPRIFSTWCPKAVAMIGSLEDTLQDRSIEIRMRRKGSDEIVVPLRSDKISAEVETLQRKMLRWAEDHREGLAEVEPVVPSELHSRAQDNWRPLFAVAQLAGESWSDLTKRASLDLSGSKEDDDDTSLLLLADCQLAFKTSDRLSTHDLLLQLQSDAERPWCSWLPQAAARELAKLLRPFGIRSRKIRFGSETAQGYFPTDFEDAFRRYLPEKAEHAEHSEQSSVSQ